MRTIFDGEQTCIQLDDTHNCNQRRHQYKRVAPKKKKPSQAAAREEPVRQVATCIPIGPLAQDSPVSQQRLEEPLEFEGTKEARQLPTSECQTVAPKTTTTTTTASGGLGQQEMDTSLQATEQVQQQHLAQQQQQQQQHQQQQEQLGRLQVAVGTNQPVTRYLMGSHQHHQQPVAGKPPKSYPNNTLVEDLSRCHDNLWPKATRATSRTLRLIRACAPTGAKVATNDDKTKQIEVSKQVNLHIAGGGDDTPTTAATAARGQLETQTENNKRLKFVRAKRKKYKFPIPDSIQRLNSTLNQEDYNRALCVLTNDIRFQLHILFFGRLQTIWTLFSTILCILIPILFAAATLETLVILGSCAIWLCLQAAGALVTSQCRKKLDQMLERSVAQANSYFLDHKLMLGVINRGGLLARSRLVIPMVYFDTFECIEQIESIISVDLEESTGGVDRKSDKDLRRRPQLVPRAHPTEFGHPNANKPGATNQKVFAQSQLAKKIVLRYSQRWISHFDKRRLMFIDDKLKPRHLSTGKCLCQFIEEHLRRDRQIEDLEELQAQQSTPVTPEQDEEEEATIEQLQVDKLASVQRDGQLKRGAATNDITQQQATIINIPTNDKNNFSELDEQLLNETLEISRSRTPAPLAGSRFASAGLHAELFVPTLSQLVSMKEDQQQQQQQSARPNLNIEISPYSSPCSNYSSKLIDGFASHLQQERIDTNSSPTTELSLELESGESPSNRNDELIKRLKTLLEIRANEFSKVLDQAGTNASLSNSLNHHHCRESASSPRPMWVRDRALLCSSGGGLSGGSSLSGQTIHQDDASKTNNNHASPISQIGKKFFNQTDGLFFLGTKKGHQPGVYAKQQQQLLEIC